MPNSMIASMPEHRVGQERRGRRGDGQRQRGEHGGLAEGVRALARMPVDLLLPGAAAAVDEEVDAEADQCDRHDHDQQRRAGLESDQRVDAVERHHHHTEPGGHEHRRPVRAQQRAGDHQNERDGAEDEGRGRRTLLLADEAAIDEQPDRRHRRLVAPQDVLHVAQPALGVEVGLAVEPSTFSPSNVSTS